VINPTSILLVFKQIGHFFKHRAGSRPMASVSAISLTRVGDSPHLRWDSSDSPTEPRGAKIAPVARIEWPLMFETLSITASEPKQDIALIFLTSDLGSVRDLFGSLNASVPFIRVEWIKPGRGHMKRLLKRLELLYPQAPAIVMLDFNSLGAEIWQLIARCTVLVPINAIEWLVVNHRGPFPRLHESLLRRITVLGGSSTTN
jgi:hypothetical protein